MKRHPSLHPLSRDHHEGLMLARTFQEAVGKGSAEQKAALLQLDALWVGVLRDHFAEEEKYLLPLFQEPLRSERLRKEHEEIHALAERLLNADRSVPSLEIMQAFAQLLHDHIRWEERELFPYLETTVSEKELQRIGEIFTQIEATRPRSRSCDNR